MKEILMTLGARSIALSAICLLFVNTQANANDLKVIELFTSQGCYSCPAADKLVAAMAERNNRILNLEFHVDYWNQLKYRNKGSWQDPFSSPEFTKRQRQYSALKLKGENGVYTPQAVINGTTGLVGSNRRALKKALASNDQMLIDVSIERGEGDELQVRIAGDLNQMATVYFVQYLKRTETQIESGENHDKLMINHNVVTDFKAITALSDVGDTPLTVVFPPEDNLGCAILVQPKALGAILGAAKCP